MSSNLINKWGKQNFLGRWIPKINIHTHSGEYRIQLLILCFVNKDFSPKGYNIVILLSRNVISISSIISSIISHTYRIYPLKNYRNDIL